MVYKYYLIFFKFLKDYNFSHIFTKFQSPLMQIIMTHWNICYETSFREDLRQKFLRFFNTADVKEGCKTTAY